MKRLPRLTQILLQLQAGRSVTAGQLAERFGVSLRTIYRDIRTLEEAGVPILGQARSGYHLLADYRIPPVMFTEQEINALVTAQQFLQGTSDQSVIEQIDGLTTKIKALLHYSDKEKAILLESRVKVYGPAPSAATQFLSAIQSAITQCQLLRLHYRSVHTENRSAREIEPLAVYFTHQHWILIALCRLRNAMREFRLDGVEALFETGRFFEPHSFSFEDYLQSCHSS